MKIHTEDTKRQLQALSTKITDITEKDLQVLERAFVDKLQMEGKSRIDWLRERGREEHAPLLTNVLNGRITSKPLLTELLNYVMD